MIYLFGKKSNRRCKKHMDSFAELWEMVKEECKNQVSESIYNVWFKDMELVSFDDNRVVIALSD